VLITANIIIALVQDLFVSERGTKNVAFKSFGRKTLARQTFCRSNVRLTKYLAETDFGQIFRTLSLLVLAVVMGFKPQTLEL
jgi:hypothetical protein